MSEQRAESIGCAQVLEVYAIMAHLNQVPPMGEGGSYGPDVTNTNYGKGRPEPYREPNRAAGAGAVLRSAEVTRQARKLEKQRMELHA